MKKIWVVMLTLALAVFAVGCNNNDNNNAAPPADQNNATDNVTDNNNDVDQNNNTNTNNDNADYPFRSFDLEVKYDNNKEYEVDYDADHNANNNTTDNTNVDTNVNNNDDDRASIEDDLNNKRIKGDEAMKQLDNYFKKLKIDSKTSDDQVIAEVLRVFNLKDDYKHFDLEIEFLDGTEKEYTKTK